MGVSDTLPTGWVVGLAGGGAVLILMARWVSVDVGGRFLEDPLPRGGGGGGPRGGGPDGGGGLRLGGGGGWDMGVAVAIDIF